MDTQLDGRACGDRYVQITYKHARRKGCAGEGATSLHPGACRILQPYGLVIHAGACLPPLSLNKAGSVR